MGCKNNKCKIIRLQKEIEKLKAEQNSRTDAIRIDDKQIEYFLDQLTERMEWSTNRIVDESKPSYIPVCQPKESDGLSSVLKCFISFPIIVFGIAVFVFLFTYGDDYLKQGFSQQLSVVFMGILCLDCILIGIEVFKEKDRNYIVALFSALVSLVALIVALVK